MLMKSYFNIYIFSALSRSDNMIIWEEGRTQNVTFSLEKKMLSLIQIPFLCN